MQGEKSRLFELYEFEGVEEDLWVQEMEPDLEEYQYMEDEG